MNRSGPRSAQRVGDLPDSNGRRKHAELNGEFFDDRSTSDPEFDGLRNRNPLFRRLFDTETVINDLFFWDDSEFRRVNGKKGARLILPVAEGEAMMKRQRRYKQPKPPPIQIMLSQAHYMKFLMEKKPNLTRAGLAREFEVTPSYLTRILNLLNLAPEIQKYIQDLPPSLRKGQITESKVKHIARMADHAEQMRFFEDVKFTNPKCRSKEQSLVACI